MNAIPIPIDTVARLNRYQKRMIKGIATRPTDEMYMRVERLKKLDFCTDDVKFEVLKQSDAISEEMYNTLYELYFGKIKEDKPMEEETKVTEQAKQAEQVEQPEQPKKKVWSDEDCKTLLHFYAKGTDIKTLARMFEVTEASIRGKLQKLKNSTMKKEIYDGQKAPAATPEQPKTKTFIAKGSGFMDISDGIALDGTLVTDKLVETLRSAGYSQFYGEIAIAVKPIKTSGMVVSVEEE